MLSPPARWVGVTRSVHRRCRLHALRRHATSNRTRCTCPCGKPPFQSVPCVVALGAGFLLQRYGLMCSPFLCSAHVGGGLVRYNRGNLCRLCRIATRQYVICSCQCSPQPSSGGRSHPPGLACIPRRAILWLAAVVVLGGGVPSRRASWAPFHGCTRCLWRHYNGCTRICQPLFQNFFKNFSQPPQTIVIARDSGIIDMPLYLTMRRHSRSIDGTMRSIGTPSERSGAITRVMDLCGVVSGRRWSGGD